MPPGAVLAIQHLASSAVEVLTPEAVSVLEMNGTLLSRPRAANGPDEVAASAALDYRQSVERDLRTKIRETLDPVLGAGHRSPTIGNAPDDHALGHGHHEKIDAGRANGDNGKERGRDGPRPGAGPEQDDRVHLQDVAAEQDRREMRRHGDQQADEDQAGAELPDPGDEAGARAQADDTKAVRMVLDNLERAAADRAGGA